MATQRPLKEGSVRTYQEKVGLGFVDILASEMDADLDTIYAAWNGGLAPNSVGAAELIDGAVGTLELADLAVTTPKLADGAVTGAKVLPVSIPGTCLTNPVGAKLFRTAASPVYSENAFQPLDFDTRDVSYGNAPPVWNGSQWRNFNVVNVGIYVLSGAVEFAASAAGTRRILSIFLNSAELLGQETSASGGSARRLAVSTVTLLAAGSVVNLGIYHDVPGGLSLTQNVLPQFSIVRVG